MLPMLLLLAAPDDLAAKARELTRAELPCRVDRDSVPHGCGFAGVTMTNGGGATTIITIIKPRKLAP